MREPRKIKSASIQAALHTWDEQQKIGRITGYRRVRTMALALINASLPSETVTARDILDALDRVIAAEEKEKP